MHYNLITLLFIILVSYLNNCFAENLNLLQIYQLATTSDPTVLAAKQIQLAEDEQLIIAQAKLLPKISLSGNQNYGIKTDKLYGLQSTRYNTKNYTLNISQPLFQLVDWVNYGAVKKQTLVELKKYEDVEQVLLLRVTEKYFAVLTAVDQLATSTAIKEAFTKRLKQANKEFKLGVASVTDVNEAQAKLDNACAKEIKDENELKTAKEGLTQIVGKIVENIAQLKAEIPLVAPEPLNVESWLEKARKHNLKLQASRLEVEAAKENIKISHAGHWPTLNATGSLNRAKSPPPGPDRTFTREIMVALEVPLFHGGTTVASTHAAAFRANAALQKLENTYREIESNTRIAYNNVITQISQVAALAQSVHSNEVALKANQAAFKAGTRTIVDVLNAQSDVLNAKKDYAKAKYEYIINGLKLKQATGSLNIVDLEQINNLLCCYY